MGNGSHGHRGRAPRRFSFRVAPPGDEGTVWTYSFHREGGGTLVTEEFEWHWTPGAGFRGRVGEMPLDLAEAAVGDREDHLRGQIRATLPLLKRALEEQHLSNRNAPSVRHAHQKPGGRADAPRRARNAISARVEPGRSVNGQVDVSGGGHDGRATTTSSLAPASTQGALRC